MTFLRIISRDSSSSAKAEDPENSEFTLHRHLLNSYNSMKQQSGFTLIEVLIALVILAISMTAIIRASSQTVANLDYLQNKTVAHWVALNTLVRLHANAIPNLNLRGINRGDEVMLAKTWQWQLSLTANPLSSDVYQATVQVSLPGQEQIFDTLSDYIFLPNQMVG